MASTKSVASCKRLLAVLWFAGALVIFLLLVFQSIFGKYGEHVEDAWGWFLPTIIPTLSLMVGVLVLDVTAGATEERQIPVYFFRLTLCMSAAYLFLVALVPIIQPMTELPPAELMKLSNLWLGPLQGLVAAVLAAFFVKAERD